MSYKSNDCPVTDKELNAFYGVALTDFEVLIAGRDQVEAFDSDDIQDIVYTHAAELLKALKQGDAATVGRIMTTEMRLMCERRTNFTVYGVAQSNADYRAACGGRGWEDMKVGA